MMEPLETLIKAAQQGDTNAFEDIVARFQDMAYASAYAMIEDAQLAEDVAQEAFIEVYLNLPKLRVAAAFPGWFRHIIFKQGDRLTRSKRLAIVPLAAAADVPMAGRGPGEIAETNETGEQVRHAIATLPENERMVIVLFYGTGYSLKDIAAFLEVPVTTIKKRLYTARQRLKDELIGVMRDVLQVQRPSIADPLPAKVHLLIAARTGDIGQVKTLLEGTPKLLNMRIERDEIRQHPVLSLATGYTALHEAAIHNHAALAQLLLDYGANANARASSGLTPLHSAVLYHCQETVAVLLECGADTNLPLNNGLTPLHIAAMKGDSAIVRLLLTHEAISDSRSLHARTPLHWAAIKGHVEIARLLLTHEADYRARDATGRTPCDWAIARSNQEIVDVLTSYQKGSSREYQ